MQRILRMALAMTLALCLLAGGAVAEHKTLTFIMPSNTTWPNGFDDVLAKFEAETGETLDVSLSFIFTGFDDIGQKVSLKLASGEAMDSVFAAQWTSPSLNEMALKDQILNLDKYFNNDEYPGLKAFSEDYLAANSFVGSDGEYHIFGLPFSNSYSGGNLFYYRKDLADKYGVTVEDETGIIAYFDAILANEPGMIPFSFLGNTDPLTSFITSFFNVAPAKHNTFTSNMLDCIIRDDGTVYVSRSVAPAQDEEYRKYMDDADPTKADPLYYLNVAQEWADKGYIDLDCLNESDHQGKFTSGKAASMARGADTFEGIKQQLESSIPGAELGYIVADRNARQGKEHQLGCTFQAWNFACIPVTCQDPDLVMRFFDWLYGSVENHDLFEYGIEGTHWENGGEGKYTAIADENGLFYNFDGFTLTWIPSMTRYSTTTPDDVLAYKQMMANPDTFFKNVDSGFSFVSDEVSSEAAKLSSLSDLAQVVKNGLGGDIASSVSEIDQKRANAGLEEYIAEFEKQFNAFLADHPYEGQ